VLSIAVLCIVGGGFFGWSVQSKKKITARKERMRRPELAKSENIDPERVLTSHHSEEPEDDSASVHSKDDEYDSTSVDGKDGGTDSASVHRL
jgi:hypothetical protein